MTDDIARYLDDEPPPEVRLAVCESRGHHLYAPSDSIRSFEHNLLGEWVRRLPCTSCRIAVRIERWNLVLAPDGTTIIDAKLLGFDSGRVEPAYDPGGRITRADIRRATIYPRDHFHFDYREPTSDA